MNRTARRKHDRAQAGALAVHVAAVQAALKLSDDQREREALARLGPVPPTCPRCHSRPPRTFLVHGRGIWLCNECAGLGELP